MGTKDDPDASCYTSNNISSSPQNMYNNNNDDDHHVSSLVYNLSILKEKFHRLQSVVIDHVVSPHEPSSSAPTPAPAASQQVTSCSSNDINIMSAPRPRPMSNITSLVQEVIATASSMMFTCQQMSINDDRVATLVDEREGVLEGGQGLFSGNDENIDWCRDYIFSDNSFQNTLIYNNNCNKPEEIPSDSRRSKEFLIGNNCDIIEMDASDLLAKYTHYCQVCGKGFKRDANLRMHMRAHGDQYKSIAALSKKSDGESQRDELSSSRVPRKYSCPQEGCKWNSRHVKFQPLKSMICVKNHYKRSHCPKMYVCRKCSQKQFSVLSDLRTHEKHCGDLKWLCSCGTTFSRKDKLMGHVALFVGHSPAIGSSSSMDVLT